METLSGVYVGQDGPQGSRARRSAEFSAIFPTALPCPLQFFLLLIRAELWELRGLKCCECSALLAFYLPGGAVSQTAASAIALSWALSPDGWVGSLPAPFERPLVGGLDSPRSSCYPWPLWGFAGLSVAVPGWDVPSHPALEQVCTHGPLARAENTPSLASRT